MKQFTFASLDHFKNCNKKVIKNSIKLEFLDNEVLDLAFESIWNLEIDNESEIIKKRLTKPTKLVNSMLYEINKEATIDDIIDSIQEVSNNYTSVLKCEASFKLKDKQKNSKYFLDRIFVSDLESSNILKDAAETLYSISDISGIYKIYDKSKNLIYIGKSYTLGKRIVQSIGERKGYYFSYAIVNNKADTDLYEIYYISLIQPALNAANKTGDKPTIQLKDIEFSEVCQYLVST